MTYVITMKAKSGLQIGQNEYKTIEEANERADFMRRRGLKVKVMSAAEAYGLEK